MLPKPLTVCKDAPVTPEYIASDTALLSMADDNVY